uniref:Uncharacterized protein n=1 Tax=Ditylenchus dipsaci TaxID=166011 RepID=A0A915CWJ0_9BILA
MPQSIVFEDIEGVPDLPAAINQLPALSHASSLEILNNHPSNGIKSMTVDVEYLQDSLESIITKFYQIFEETSMERTHLLIFKTDSLIQNKAYAAVPTDVSEAITERLLQNINLSCLFISMDISSPLRANNWIISSLASITSNNISLVTRPIQQLSFFFRLAKKNSTEDFDFSLWKSSYWRHYVLYSIKRCRNLTFAAVRMSLVRVNLTQHEKLFKAVGQLWNSILENLAEALSPNAKFVVKLRLMLKGYNSGESARFLAFSDQLQGALSKKGYQMIDRTIKTQTHTNSTRPDITMIYVEENTPSFQFYIHAYCENCYQE